MSAPVVGLDLSLTSSGFARGSSVGRLTPPKHLTGLERLRWIRGSVLEVVAGAGLVVVEGLAFSSHTGKAAERAGLWWLVVDALDVAGLPVAVAPPASRCRYATGKGNAPKDAVLAAACRRFPAVDVTGNDQADALWLAAMGCAYLGYPMVELPVGHRQALSGVAWPLVPGPAVAGVA